MSDEKKTDKSPLGDVLKKVINTGLGAAFMTEEAIRKTFADQSENSSELINGLIQNARTTKNEFISSVKTELKSYLKAIDIDKEIDRILEQYDMHFDIKLSFSKKNKPSTDESTTDQD
jgi:predicted DNA-binding protein (UPF0278 family)